MINEYKNTNLDVVRLRSPRKRNRKIPERPRVESETGPW